MKKITKLEEIERPYAFIISFHNGGTWRLYKFGEDNYIWDQFDMLIAPQDMGQYKVQFKDAINNALTLGWDLWVADSVEELLEVLQK